LADYLPHTDDDVTSMLAFLGMNSLDDLFAHIPSAIRLASGLQIERGVSEPDVAAIFAGYTRATTRCPPSSRCSPIVRSL
jgi:glycine dehydrogenase subunit 1